MRDIYSRTSMLIGKEAVEKLKNSSAIVFGVGGVGGYCVEALARAGMGRIAVVDFDTVDITNKNRQIIALSSTVAMKKIDVVESRLADINEDISVEKYDIFVDEHTLDGFDLGKYDYVIDAIDYVKGKIHIIKKAKEVGTRVISSMGMGNKIFPELIRIEDIEKTSVCPLAKKVRKELRSMGIKGVKAVYSKEEPLVRSTPPGSISFVPSVAGLYMAKEVVLDIVNSTMQVKEIEK